MVPAPRIAIIGGGPAGLTLANILKKNNILFSIFEKDASPNERSQGGTLDLHPSAGQLAIRQAGLWDEFVKHARPESDVLKVVRLDGEVLWDGNTNGWSQKLEEDKFAHRPEIDRRKLKEVLLNSLDTTSLHFGKTLAEAVPSNRPDSWDLHFRDGSVEKGFDLVIGAEGAWSHIRKLLTPTEPVYSGIIGIELWALDVNNKRQWMEEYVGSGSLFSFGEGRSIQIQRMGDGSIRTYVCLRKPESFIDDCGIDWTQPENARKELVERYYYDCGEDLKRMILESSDELIPRPLYMLPVGIKWDSQPGLTLLGDAAHLMTPFAGVGVNAAMLDALELGLALIELKEEKIDSLTTAIKRYEHDLFPRGQKFAEKTMKNLKAHFGADGCGHMISYLKMANCPPQNH